MGYPQEIIDKLAPLVVQLGSVQLLNTMPLDTIFEAVTHADDVIGISDASFLIELTGLEGGYSVFNRELHLQYTVDAPAEDAWGKDSRDIQQLLNLQHGDFFYVAYNQADSFESDGVAQRVILVVYAGTPEAAKRLYGEFNG